LAIAGNTHREFICKISSKQGFWMTDLCTFCDDWRNRYINWIRFLAIAGNTHRELIWKISSRRGFWMIDLCTLCNDYDWTYRQNTFYKKHEIVRSWPKMPPPHAYPKYVWAIYFYHVVGLENICRIVPMKSKVNITYIWSNWDNICTGKTQHTLSMRQCIHL